MGIRVRFESAEEFLEELGQAHAAGEVAGGIVRVRRRLRKLGGSLDRVYLVHIEAGYIAASQQLVALELCVGEDGWNDDLDARTRVLAESIQMRVESAALELGCDVRGGAFELVG